MIPLFVIIYACPFTPFLFSHLSVNCSTRRSEAVAHILSTVTEVTIIIVRYLQQLMNVARVARAPKKLATYPRNHIS